MASTVPPRLLNDIFKAPDPAVAPIADIALIYHTLQSLPPKQQSILSLFYEQRKPIRIIAIEMTCSPSAARRALGSALQTLRQCCNPAYRDMLKATHYIVSQTGLL